jgi:trigger factor
VIRLTVTADADEIKGEARKILNTFLREAQIPGFRKGKVPVELVRRNFEKELKEETEGACFRAFYPKAVEESKLKVIALEGVEEIKVSETDGMSFSALVEIRPQFKLPKYKGLPIEQKDTKVEESAIDAQVEDMRKMFAQYDDAKEGEAAAGGDFVQIDFKGTIDGKPIAETMPDLKSLGEADGAWVQVADDGRFPPEIVAALEGIKAGEEKDGVAVKFSEPAAPDALKGKEALFHIKARMIRKQTMPDDAKLVESSGSESMEKLRAGIRERLEKRATEEELGRRREQAIDLLLKKTDFAVPPTMVQRQTEINLGQFAQQMQYAGVTSDYIEQNRESIIKNASDQAEKQVRLYYILHDIAEAEKLESDEKDESKKDHALAEKALDLVLAEAKK